MTHSFEMNNRMVEKLVNVFDNGFKQLFFG